MSKIAKQNIYLPNLFTFEMQLFNNKIVCWFSGPYSTWKKQYSKTFPFYLYNNHFSYRFPTLATGFNFFNVSSLNNLKMENQRASLLHVQLKQLIIGTSVGFKKFLRLRGVGYKFSISSTKLKVQVGYSHLLKIKIPLFKSFIMNKKATIIRGKSFNLVLLSTFFAGIRSMRLPDVYKGKGIRYRQELIMRKEGKKKKQYK
jgi:large subunit ribosomal protein L6